MQKFDRVTKILLSFLVVGVWCLLVHSVFRLQPVEASSAAVTNQTQQIIKARGLILVDEQGRERIIMGTPVPDPPKVGKRVSAAHGMIILDERGYERFGLGLMDNGNMGMGFDAPFDPANPKNPERIHFMADAKGGAMIRFLNRQTGVPGWIRLGDDDKLYLEFIDVQRDKNKVVKRSIGMDGEKTIEEPFKK